MNTNQITLFDLLYLMSMTVLVAVRMEAPRIANGYHMEK